MPPQGLIFEFDDVRVNSLTEEVFKAGQRLALEPKAFRVLLFFLRNRGRLIEKEELLSAIWPDTFVSENVLTRDIALLRKALGDQKRNAQYIETVPTRGYRFVGQVTVRRNCRDPTDCITSDSKCTSAAFSVLVSAMALDSVLGCSPPRFAGAFRVESHAQHRPWN